MPLSIDEQLLPHRNAIDSIDAEILRLLNERACPFQFADSMRMTGALVEQTEDFRIDAVDGIAVRQ